MPVTVVFECEDGEERSFAEMLRQMYLTSSSQGAQTTIAGYKVKPIKLIVSEGTEKMCEVTWATVTSLRRCSLPLHDGAHKWETIRTSR